MAKSENQKLKLLYIMEKLINDTDENHGITTQEIIEYLNLYDINAERKSIYDDIDSLKKYGMDIIQEKSGRQVYYKLVSRDFELPELKILVDLVQVARFLTPNKTSELIKKLEKLTSRYEASQLQRQVHIFNRVKNPNEKIYILVDTLHEAIKKNAQISFQYGVWNMKKQLVPKHGGRIYRVSPFALTWDDDNYYLIGYHEDEKKIKHFRVDKMLGLSILNEKRHGENLFQKFDLPSYSNKTFGMFGGKEERVKLKVKNSLVGVILDRFGTDVMIMPDKNGECFMVNVDVAVSRQFMGWVIGLGKDIQIVEPEWLCMEMKSFLGEISDLY